MNSISRLLLPGLLLMAVFPVVPAMPADQPMLSFGTAQVDITPTARIPMSGYGGRTEPFQKVHDEIFARVAAFSDGEHIGIILTADLIGLSHEFWTELADRLKREAGVPPEYFLLAAAHNHGGPVTRVNDRNAAPEAAAYIDSLQIKFVELVKQAIGQLKPVRIGASKGSCQMNINRRARHPNGGIVLGQNPTGPRDDEVGVVLVEDLERKPVSLLFNWACHGTVMGPRNYDITGDWPGSASRFIERAYDQKITAPVTIGASGDINPIYGPHIDFHDNRAYAFGVDSIGMILGEEVIRVAREIHTRDRGSIRASQRLVTLPSKMATENGVPLRLTVLKVANLVFAGVSGEVFTEIGMQVKKQSPYSHTFVITHCNGSSGYLVTDKAYPEGGYEVGATRVKSGAERAIVDNLLDMIHAL